MVPKIVITELQVNLPRNKNTQNKLFYLHKQIIAYTRSIRRKNVIIN